LKLFVENIIFYNMAENKKSFLLYCDTKFTIDKLTDEQSGKLFKHILNYVNDLNPVLNDLLLEIAFEPIKQNLKRDLKKYLNVCERNKLNGLKGGRPKNPSEPKKPSGLIGNPKNPSKPKKADNDNDNEIVNEYVNKNNIDKNFIPIINKWLVYKKEKKDKYTQSGLIEFIKSLINLSESKPLIAEKIINQSMANNWKGIFELKTENKQKTILKAGDIDPETGNRILAS